MLRGAEAELCCLLFLYRLVRIMLSYVFALTSSLSDHSDSREYNSTYGHDCGGLYAAQDHRRTGVTG